MTSSFGGTGKHSNAVVWIEFWKSALSQVFPSYSSAQRIVTKDSALAKIQEKRRRALAATPTPVDACSSLQSFGWLATLFC